VDDLESAGIRFVYFSPYSEYVTKAFGERLGLETDWNSCIVLSSPQRKSNQAEMLTSLAASDFSYCKSKLPRGVENVRPHLRDVDDIPLHVSLFAECDPASMVEMVRIYRENGEVVCVIGSSMNPVNSAVMLEANVAIGMEPGWIRKSQYSNALGISSDLTSLNCPMTFPFDTSPYVFTELIREARFLCRVSGSMFVHLLSTSTVSFLFIGFLLYLSQEVSSFTAILVFFFVPAMSCLTFLLAPYEANIMKLTPGIYLLMLNELIVFRKAG